MQNSLIFLIFATLSICSFSIVKGEEEAVVSFPDALLVLESGDILQGDITRRGERFEVVIPGGGRVWIGAERVIVVARSKEDAYLYLVARNDPGDPDAHIWLARWSCRQGMLDHAQHELEVVQLLDPEHRELPGLMRRVQASLASFSPAAVEPEVEQASSPSLPPREEALPQRPEPRDYAPEVMRQFTQTVQPILFNGCATSACHGNGSHSEFQLRVPLDGSTTAARLTHANIASILHLIDESDPEESRLLRIPSAPHGGLESALFAEEDQQRARLLAWIELAAATSLPEHQHVPQADIFERPAENLTEDAAEPIAEPDSPIEDPVSPEPEIPVALPPPSDVPTPSLPEGAATTHDPYDPTIFNSGRD